MEMSKSNGVSPKGIVLWIVFIILTVLLWYAFPYGNYGWFYFGVIPAPFAHWIFFTFVYVAFIVYIAFYYDPYRWWTEEMEEAEGRGEGRQDG